MPIIASTFGSKTLKLISEVSAAVPTITLILPVCASAGTDTVSEVAVGAGDIDTVAAALSALSPSAPRKVTVLSAAVVLKPVPVINDCLAYRTTSWNIDVDDGLDVGDILLIAIRAM